MIVGVVLINLWIVLDCCDGNIARVTKKSSYMGEFIDAVSGYVICAFNFLAIGLAAYNRSTLLFGEKNVWLVVIGAVACISNLFARLIYQKYTNCCFVTESISPGPIPSI
jgi:phosphatidylglycerophosphate synthase